MFPRSDFRGSRGEGVRRAHSYGCCDLRQGLRMLEAALEFRHVHYVCNVKSLFVALSRVLGDCANWRDLKCFEFTVT